MTVDEYLAEWLEAQQSAVETSTYEAIRIYIQRHLMPFFSGLELAKLTSKDVQGYIRHKSTGGRCDGKEGGLSTVSVRKHVSVLKQALKDAVLDGYIASNPALNVKMKKQKSGITEKSVLMSTEEAQAVLEIFEGHPIYLAVALSLYYGLRRSEVLGLRWSSIDFKFDTITINHTIVKNVTIVAKDRTKTEASKRTYELLPELKTALLQRYNEQGKISDYVFCWQDGRTMRPDYVTKSFQKVLKRNGFKHMRFHDLRHSTASILFDRGWQLEDVKNWLGHSDIETTSNIYLHYGSARKKLLAKGLEGMFEIAKKP